MTTYSPMEQEPSFKQNPANNTTCNTRKDTPEKKKKEREGRRGRGTVNQQLAFRMQYNICLHIFTNKLCIFIQAWRHPKDLTSQQSTNDNTLKLNSYLLGIESTKHKQRTLCI